MSGDFIDMKINIKDEVSPLLEKYGKVQGNKQINRVIGAVAYEFKGEYKKDIMRFFKQKTGKGIKRVGYRDVKQGATVINVPFPYHFFERKGIEVAVEKKKILSDGSTFFGKSFMLPYIPVIESSFRQYVGSGKVQKTAEKTINRILKETGF